MSSIEDTTSKLISFVAENSGPENKVSNIKVFLDLLLEHNSAIMEYTLKEVTHIVQPSKPT